MANLRAIAAALQGFGAGVQGNGPQFIQGIQNQKYNQQLMSQQQQDRKTQQNEEVKRRLAQEFQVAYQHLAQPSPNVNLAAQALSNIANTPLVGNSPAGQKAREVLNAIQGGDPVKASLNLPMAAKALEPVLMDFQARGYFEPEQQANRPASVEEWEYYKSLNKEDQAEFRRLQGSGYLRYDPQSRGVGRQEDVLDIQATATPEAAAAAQRQQAVGNVETQQALTEQEQLYNQTREQELGEQQVSEENRVSAKEDQVGMLKGLINQARDKAGAFTTGTIGATTRRIPGTPAYDLNAQLETIRANIGFDKLQEMRDNSPTGGALGQVSEMENRLLQATWGNLQQSQSREQFLSNLDLLEDQLDRSWERVAKAFEETYGVPYSGEVTPGNEGGELDSLLNRYLPNAQ